MLRKRRGNGSVVIYRVFLAAMIAAVVLFLMRVASGKLETDFSVGQVIHLSQNYEMGNIYDGNGELIANGSRKSSLEYENETTATAFQDIIGADISQTLGIRNNICSNALYIYGTQTNALDMKNLIVPSKSVKKGGDVKLTLRKDLQEHLAAMIAESGYEKAYVVVSNYKNGEVLAMYSNEGNCLDAMLHPGSTMKPFYLAAALSVDPQLVDYTYDCEADSHDFGSGVQAVHINCAGKTNHGTTDYTKAMAKSCNAWFVSLLDHVDSNKLLEALKVWGFDSSYSFQQFRYSDHSFEGQNGKINRSAAKAVTAGMKKLGIDLREKNLRYAVIGQGNTTITPEALNFLTGALLNGGTLKEPVWIEAKRTSATAGEWEELESEKEYVMCQKDVADTVVQTLEAVMESGTGRSFAMPEAGLVGKTGTAEKADRNGNLSGMQTVWFTGGLTGEFGEANPIAITVAIDDVDSSVTSSAAGTFAKDILKYMLTEGGSEDE